MSEENPVNYLTAFEALQISNTEPTKSRFVRILDLIRAVANNGKKRALIALEKDDDSHHIQRALERLGYDVEMDLRNKDCLIVSWWYAEEGWRF